MPDFDIDVDDYLDECSTREIKEVIKWLVESDYIEDPEIFKTTRGASTQLFDEAVHKLIGNSHHFTLQEEEYVINLAKRIS
jgi:hypothetical protein